MQREIAYMLMVILMAAMAAPLAGQEAAHQQFLFTYKLLQRGEDAQAIRAFDEFLEKYPQDDKRPDALYYRALLSQRGGNNESAAQFLRNVGEPQHVPVYAIHLLRGQIHTSLGQFDHALAALEQIQASELQDDRLRASVYQLRGGAYRALGNFNAAVESLKAAGAIDSPLKAQALLDLGRVHAARNEHEQAVDALRQAIDAAGSAAVTAEAAHVAGDQSYLLKRHDDAIAFYRMVLTHHQTSPHFSPAVVGTMWALLAEKQYRQVLDAMEQYQSSLSPDDRAAAGYLAGSALQEMGEHARAIEMLQSVAQGAEGSRHHAQLLYKIATSQFETQQYDAMAATLQSLFKAHPQSRFNMDGQFLLAATEAKRGNTEEGIARLTAIVEYEPRHPYHDQALLQRAQLHEQSGQLAEAIEDYLRYLALPGMIDEDGRYLAHDPVLRVSDLHFRLGRYDAVVTTLERLLQSDPQPSAAVEALYRIAHAKLKRDEQGPAMATFTRLIEQYSDSALTGQAYYYRGLLQLGMGHAHEGLSDLEKAGANDNLPQALRVNALRLSAVAQRELADPEPAVRTLTQLRQLAGLTADEMLWLAKHFYASGQASTAVAYLEPLVDASRSVPPVIRGEALFLLGQSYRKAEAHAQAIATFERVLREHFAFEPHARLALAQTLRDAGRVDDAMQQYSRASTSQVSRVAAEALFDMAQIHRERAMQRRRAEDRAGAIEAMQQAYDDLKRLTVLYAFAELSPLPELSLIQLAEIAQQQGDDAARDAALRELTEKFPDGPYAVFGRAALAQAHGRRSEARVLVGRLQESLDTLDARLARRVTALHDELEAAP